MSGVNTTVLLLNVSTCSALQVLKKIKVDYNIIPSLVYCLTSTMENLELYVMMDSMTTQLELLVKNYTEMIQLYLIPMDITVTIIVSG